MNNKFISFTVIAIGYFFANVFVFHPMFCSHFNLLPGDIGDERLVLYILNHWYNVFSGFESFWGLNFLYPDKHVLGYSDAFFIFGIIYSIVRLLGFDYFTSIQLLYLVIVAIGYFGAIFLLRKILKINLIFSIIGAILFVGLNSIQNQFGHGQLLGFYFYPLLTCLMALYFGSKDSNSNKLSWIYIISFNMLLGFFFFTSYYPAFLFVFSLILFATVYLFLEFLRHSFKDTVFKWLNFVKFNIIELMVGFIVFVISLIPFLINYLPVIIANNHFEFSEVLFYSPSFKDIINVGGNNYFWSPILSSFHFNYGNMEYSSGFPCFFLIVFMLFFLSYFLSIKSTALELRKKIMFSVAITAIVIFFMIVKFTNHFSLWYIVYHLVPGAKSIRALGRYLIVSQILALFFLLYNLNSIYMESKCCNIAKQNKIYITLLMFVIPVLMLFEQANKGSFHLTKSDQINFLNKFQRNHQCDIFYIDRFTQTEKPLFAYQTDALMVSMKLGMSTLNGYSGIMPKEWNLFDPSSPAYLYHVYQWIKINRITNNMCALNLNTGEFKKIDLHKLKQEAFIPFINTFDKLHLAAEQYIEKSKSLTALYPKALEENGYLDKSFGYAEGAANNWTKNGGWIGKWPCPDGKAECFGVGLVGDIDVLRPIIEKYNPQALQIFFPYPKTYSENSKETSGQLLMIFRAPK